MKTKDISRLDMVLRQQKKPSVNRDERIRLRLIEQTQAEEEQKRKQEAIFLRNKNEEEQLMKNRDSLALFKGPVTTPRPGLLVTTPKPGLPLTSPMGRTMAMKFADMLTNKVNEALNRIDEVKEQKLGTKFIKGTLIDVALVGRDKEPPARTKIDKLIREEKRRIQMQLQ